MSDDMPEVTVDDERVATRGLVGAEVGAGSDDPEAQARTILEDSEIRTLDRDAAPGSVVEHRRSEDTVPPDGT
jgi:chromosome condensin MukBEF MukE localization factor